jgi:Patatin-like phospholipase
MRWRGLILVAAAFLLSACVGARPPDAMCKAETNGQAYSASMANVLSSKWQSGPGAQRQHLDILVLSGGGAWGAYGAGFLDGWSKREAALGTPRPQFDVVTGVSTGAIIGTFALLGPDYDSVLEDAYRGTSSGDLFYRRSIFMLPFWNSFNDPEPIEDNLTRALSDDTIAKLAEAFRERRSLWAGAVNFDTGRFTEFDLTDLAAELPPDIARREIVDRLMAASAVPGFFPPRFIGGCMYMDGDVRQNLFVSEIGGAIDAAAGAKILPENTTVDIYAIVNGTTEPSQRLTDNTLIGVGVRGFELAFDQIQIASLREIYDYAKAKGFHLYWTSADDVVAIDNKPQTYDRCSAPKGETDQFNGQFTACLFDAARQKAETDAMPWRTDRP